MRSSRRAIVVGSGPNGLAGAIRLAQADHKVTIYEAQPTIGGGLRSLPLTEPGFIHDLCATVLPLALASPFLGRLPLRRYGVAWVQPPAPLAHPFDDGTAIVLERSPWRTASALGVDGDAYLRLMEPLVRDAPMLIPALLGPLRPLRHPSLARFGVLALLSAKALAWRTFHTTRARALFAGLAAHSFLPLDSPISAAFGLVLGMLAHAVGWPIVRGGAQRLADALVSLLYDLGGSVVPSREIRSLATLPSADAYLLDIDPGQAASIAGERFSAGFQAKLRRHRYGPAAFKIDYALAGSIPWRAEACRRAGTIHIGGSFEDIAASERAANEGKVAERPFVLLAQPSQFDPTRAPVGMQAVWAYCHVPFGSTADMTDRIEAQIERFAPGFRDRIITRSVANPARLQALNANEVGGAINGGAQDLTAMLRQATALPSPYVTTDPAIYLCSASTPPGGGVHGMCGFHAAQAALRHRQRDDL
ncbi:MAG: NAD(P)/FAD-dependent oxidoreductase [Thermomicrobiales bacterium]|nr:NAD(P)/FAD-dependent oxidoreductase [Thermomicrobiales bacterium]